MTKFIKAGLKELLENKLFEYFGYKQFRGRQKEAIEAILQNKHVMTIMPTGSGKSIIYQLPALLLSDLTMVISPLIALMKDQVDVLRRKQIDATFVNSSLKKSERAKRYQAIGEGKYKILYVTPERFRKKEFLEIIARRKISLLAVDEAHCISEWGHDFRPDYTRLIEIRQMLNNPVTIALTATATPEVQKDIISQLGLKEDEVHQIHEGIDRPNLFLQLRSLWGEDEKLQAILKLLNQHKGSGIIYFVLIKDLSNMSDLLQRKGIKHLVYHGDLDAAQRKSRQNQFMNNDNQLVLATNAFGMGIDKENIRFVIHAQIPGSLEAYYQEIGRAGRDGKDSICTLLYDEMDLNIQMEFMKWNNPNAEFYYRAYQLLKGDMERINGEGLEYLKEQLTYKNRRDYRTETVLGILDRWGVTEGNIEKKNLQIVTDLPDELSDQEYLDVKLKNEQQKLYKMMMYAKLNTCRKSFIHEYFGLEHTDKCMACDNDT
ncbi:MAG: RecQ family ATP-dependent DNA helicase [Calditrichaceae bacterium]